MTVAELIAELQKLPQDLAVTVAVEEWEDCEAETVEIRQSGPAPQFFDGWSSADGQRHRRDARVLIR